MGKDIKKVESKSYTLYTKNGNWLGQVVLTSDGAFMAITDYGNFNFAWRAYGNGDFREFISRIDIDYFAQKMANGMYYIVYNKKVDKAAQLFAEKILPPLQELLKNEIELESSNKESGYLQNLFDHMSNEHGLTLLQSEMQDIIDICSSQADYNPLLEEKIKLRETLGKLISRYEMHTELTACEIEEAKQALE